MKKFLLTLFCVITFTSLSADEITETFKFSDYTKGIQYAKNEEHKLSEKVTIYTTECHFTTELRIYSSSTHNGYVVSDALPGTIKSMKFNIGENSDKLDVYGSNDGSTWTNVGTITVSSSYKDYTLNFTGSYTHFKLDVAGSKQLRIASMSITYEVSNSGGGDEDTPVDLTDEQFNWSDATAVATIGAANTFPELTNTENVPVAYSSSDEGVATIDAKSGEITLNEAGETIISAVSTATDDYNLKTVTYTLTVNPAPSGGEEGETVTWVAETDTTNPGSGKDWFTDAIDDYTKWIATEGTNPPKYYDTGKGLRVYNGGTFTITSSRIISSITLTFSSTSYTFSANNTSATQTVNPNSNTYEWSVTRTCRLQKIEITYATAAVETRVSEVTFSPNSGVVAEGTAVTLSCATEGASIYYTIDGNEPTTESTLYADPIVINDDVTIKAVAIKDGESSDISEASYTVIKAYDSLNQILALDKDSKFICNAELTVYEVRSSKESENDDDCYVFVYNPAKDEYALIYKYNPGLQAGQTIKAGWIGVVDLYGGLKQLESSEALEVGTGEATMPTVVEVTKETVADILVADNLRRPFIFKNVTVGAYSSKTCTGTLGETSINLYNNFGIDTSSLVADAAYDVYGILNSYNGEVQLNPITFTEAEVAPEVPEGVKYTKVNSFNETMTRQSNSNAGGYGFILCGEIDGTLYVMSTQSGSNVIKATEADIRVDGNIYLVGDDHNHYEFYINNSGNGNYYLWSKEGDNVNVISTDVETNSLYLESIANAEANGHVYLCEITNATSQPVSSAMHKAVSGNEVDIVFDNKNTVNLIGLYRDDVNGHYFGANTILADEPFEKVYLYASEDGQTTGVENVIDELTNNHAEVEFYNLQGVRVDKPAAGIYIRRQGNTAVKIFVK